MTKEMKMRKFFELTLFFMVYAMIGWAYEVFLETCIYQWGFSNRGVLFGPWLPVYGFGTLIFILLWYPLIKGKDRTRKAKMLPVIFLLTMLTATAIELGTTYLFELAGKPWPWQTYADYSINFQARIALNPSIRFGLGGTAFLYVVQPALDKITEKLTEKKIKVIALIILSVLACDMIYTFIIK